MTPLTDTPPVHEALLHVMLVDDEDDYHLITRMMLKKAGFNGRFSAFLEPEAALAHLRSSPSPPDLLLLDINMPATNGFEFIAECSTESLLACGRTTVVMCSSSNRPMDIEMARQLPCVCEYVEKPLISDLFNQIVERHNRRLAPINT